MRRTGHVAPSVATPPLAQRKFSAIYPATLCIVPLICLSLFWLMLVAAGDLGIRPPPQISNNLCIDQKLARLRINPIERPDILAIGSSVAWRSFDGEAVVRASGGRVVPLNAAFCGLKLNQTDFVARYFLGHLPSVQTVVAIIAPQDLSDCSTVQPQVFDPEDVDKFVYRRSAEFSLYLKYFDPPTLAKNIFILWKMRKGGLSLDSMDMDRYEDAPLKTTASRPDLVYGALSPLDPACLSALGDLAKQLTRQNRRFVVVTMPLNPEWKTRYDPHGIELGAMARQIRGALIGTTAELWNADRDFPMRSDAFTDAIHIRWSAAQRFSSALVAATGLANFQHDSLSGSRHAF